MENLESMEGEVMAEESSQSNQTAAIDLLLQGTNDMSSDSPVIQLDEGHVLGSTHSIEMTEEHTESQTNPLQSQLCVADDQSNHDHVTINEISDMSGISGVDIVTLQQSGQLPSMFQLVTSSSGEGSFVIPDGHIMQSESIGSGEDQDIKIHLSNGMTLIQKQGGKDIGGIGRVVEGQVIELNESILHESVNQEGLQSVQLDDGSTAYIAAGLFADGGGPLNIDIASSASDIHPNLEIASDIQNQIVVSQPTTTCAVKVESNESNEPVISVVNSPRPDIITPASQPHVSDRALALGDKAYKCLYEGCGRLYTTQHHLKVHERSHTGHRPFRCEFPGCNKAFATGYGLKSHTRVHTNEKPYRCPDVTCNKSFKTSGDLQKHVRTHTGERPFRCPFEGCDRSFTTSNIRKVHIRTHTGEKPYICPEEGCNKAFASATNYKNHTRIHSGEKPYVCTVEGCGKRFTEYSSLYKHHVVHTQSKPYICNHCNKTYRQTSTLAMHKRTIHNDHDINLEMPESLITTYTGLGGLQIISPLQKDDLTEAERESMEDEQALVINTAEQALGTGSGTSQGMLTTLQANQISSGLLQQLQPTATLSGTGQIQQVYLITDPLQIETLKRLAAQHESPTDGELGKSVGFVASADDAPEHIVPSAISCDSSLLTESSVAINPEESSIPHSE